MSYVYTNIAWQAPLRTAAKFVLVSLADQANDEGICWPSIARLCARVAMTDRGVQLALNELVELGYLIRHMRTGRSTYYQLTTPEPTSGVSGQTPEQGSGSPPNDVRGTPEQGSGITIKELPIELPIEKAPSPAKPKKPRTRKTEQTLPEWAKSQPAGQELIPADHPARKFAAEAGIPDAWVALAWKAFADKHMTSGKTYKDWGQAFRNAVAGNWEKVWYHHDDGTWRLTTVGHGLDRVVNGAVA